MDYAAQNQTCANVGVRSWATDWRMVNVAIAVVTAALFVGYLAVNTRTAADGFTVHELERRVADLEEQKQRLDLQMLDRQALDSVEERAQAMGFVPVGHVEYLNIGSGAVAVR